MGAMGQQQLGLAFGNSAQSAGADKWAWQAFLKLGACAPLVRRAELFLHPTFSPSRVELRHGDASGVLRSATFTGWGTFQLRAEIHFDPALVAAPPSATLTHQLSFDQSSCETPQTVAVTMRAPKCPAPAAPAAAAAAPAAAPAAPAGGGAACADRGALAEKLRRTGFLKHSDPGFWHGRALAGSGLAPPKASWVSKQRPRDDHDAPEWLTATEFQDTPEARRAKCAQLAALLRASKRTVLYTGAGISAPAGIGQAARGSAGGSRSTDAQPTLTHYAMGALSDAGLLHGWVQQNHDGLPQKAGFPQENINEIHGSWYDPGNPVVKYSGTLHSRAYPWMRREAEQADLVIVLGTSLGGLNADQMATKPAGRSTHGKALGTVIVNLQQTEQDGKASLRLFGQSDEVMREVLGCLGIPAPQCKPRQFVKESRVAVPYDRAGKRSRTERTWLDLRDGAAVRLAPGHNVQGAQQPAYMHIGAEGPVQIRGRTVQPCEGLGRVVRRDDSQAGFVLNIEGAHMMLGTWWLETAARGAVEQLPIINVEPQAA